MLLQRRTDELAEVDNAAQQVVEVVRETRGEIPYSAQLGRASRQRLHLDPLSHVMVQTQHDRPGAYRDHGGTHAHGNRITVLTDHIRRPTLDEITAGKPSHEGFVRSGLVRRVEIPLGRAHDFRASASQQGFRPSVGLDNLSGAGVRHKRGVCQMLEQMSVPVF